MYRTRIRLWAEKNNMAYRRFRHFGKDKVSMDFAFFAIAFNIKKMCKTIAKQSENAPKSPNPTIFLSISQNQLLKNQISWKKCIKLAAWKIFNSQTANSYSRQKACLFWHTSFFILVIISLNVLTLGRYGKLCFRLKVR